MIRRQFRGTIPAPRRTVQSHQAMSAQVMDPETTTSLQPAGGFEIDGLGFRFNTTDGGLRLRAFNRMPAQKALGKASLLNPGLRTSTFRTRHRVHADLMTAVLTRS